jgi:type III secretory pathway component EscT
MPHIAATSSTEAVRLWLENAIVGAAFGLSATIVAAAAAAGGSLVDNTLALRIFSREVLTGADQGPFARLYALAFACAFVGTGSMTRLCERFAQASSLAAIHARGATAVLLVGASFENAISLAAPALVGGLFASIVAGLISRVAPRINGLTLASPLIAAAVLAALFASAVPVIRILAHLARAADAAPPI